MASLDGVTLPFAWYSDEQLLRRERERIFARTWQYGGRADQVAEPGSYLATDAGGIPILVVRDRTDQLRAFINVCRHRGAVLMEGAGRRETLQCQYHAWTYELDGSLKAAPRSEREEGFDDGGLSLLPASAATWGPFLFVNPDAEAAPLTEHLGELPTILARDIELDQLVFHSRVEFGSNANWKIVAENFLECYHCPTAHPALSALVDVHPDRFVLEPHPTFAAEFCSARESSERGQFHLIYPNTGINVFPGPPNLSIGPITPSGAMRTERYLDYFFHPDVDDRWLEEFFAFDEQVGVEDASLVESVQRGVSSGMLEHGRLLPRSEALVAVFDSWLRAQLDGAV